MNRKLPILNAQNNTLDTKHRSKNPDLLFDDIILERVNRIKKVWEFDLESSSLDRITVFATHKCNLFCEYCNGPHMKKDFDDNTLGKGKKNMLKLDISLSDYRSLLENAIRKYNIKHVHFTGGEATLHPELLEMVRYTKEKGVLSSITTNGRAKNSLYMDLINAGLTEVRISIDADNGDDYDSIVKIKGAFDDVISSINCITEMRDKENSDVFLVLNACVGECNLDKIVEVIKFLLSLKPDDVKLLLIAQEKKFIMSQEKESYIFALKELLEGYSENRFVLLRRKINDLFDDTVMGMRDEVSQEIAKHCFIPMTERTVDGKHYYPCSIYVRHYGEPIGEISEHFYKQTEKVINFTYNHDCRKDPICLEYCIGCTKRFNIEANKEVNNISQNVYNISSKVMTWEKARFKQILKEFNEFDGKFQIRPFIIIKPFGYKVLKDILRIIDGFGLKPLEVAEIDDFASFSQLLYFNEKEESENDFVYQKYRAMQKIYDENKGFVVFLPQTTSFRLLGVLKGSVRKRFLPKRMILNISNGLLRSMKMTVMHSPEAKDLIRENKVIKYFLNRFNKRKGRDDTVVSIDIDK